MRAYGIPRSKTALNDTLSIDEKQHNLEPDAHTKKEITS
jgi:hypothetical protein